MENCVTFFFPNIKKNIHIKMIMKRERTITLIIKGLCFAFITNILVNFCVYESMYYDRKWWRDWCVIMNHDIHVKVTIRNSLKGLFEPI